MTEVCTKNIQSMFGYVTETLCPFYKEYPEGTHKRAIRSLFREENEQLPSQQKIKDLSDFLEDPLGFGLEHLFYHLLYLSRRQDG